jgi:hypothetical protein
LKFADFKVPKDTVGTGEHGGLVRKILETNNSLAGGRNDAANMLLETSKAKERAATKKEVCLSD